MAPSETPRSNAPNRPNIVAVIHRDSGSSLLASNGVGQGPLLGPPRCDQARARVMLCWFQQPTGAQYAQQTFCGVPWGPRRRGAGCLNGLLELAMEAHGGLRRWREVTSITASLSCGGSILIDRGWVGALDDVAVTVGPRVQRAVLAPFTAPDRRGLFTPDRVVIDTNRGQRVDERTNPRAAFAGGLETPWDALDLAYFVGCAMWTSLTIPFLLNEPGFVTEELEPWQEDGETWRRLRAVFPDRVACHNRDQVFYFGPDGLLRRHDYNMEVVANLATADYADDHRIFGGISFPTLRRAVGRLPDGVTEPEPAFFTIDIAHVTVASRA